MTRDKYGHYVNDKGVEINVNTSKDGKNHINFYDRCPADNQDHSSIHINYDSDSKTGEIVDTTDGDKENTDFKCFLTSACIKHMNENFKDNCEELMILRNFRDKYVTKEDIKHYYEIAPIIVKAIDNSENSNLLFNYIYKNVINACVIAIKNGNYEFAYNRYKNSVLVLEKEYAKPALEQRLVKVLRLVRKNVKD